MSSEGTTRNARFATHARGDAGAWASEGLAAVVDVASPDPVPPILAGIERSLTAQPAIDGHPDPLVERVLVAELWLRRRRLGDRVRLAVAAVHDGTISALAIGDGTALLARGTSWRVLTRSPGPTALGTVAPEQLDVVHARARAGDIVVLASAALHLALGAERIAGVAIDAGRGLSERAERLVADARVPTAAAVILEIR